MQQQWRLLKLALMAFIICITSTRCNTTTKPEIIVTVSPNTTLINQPTPTILSSTLTNNGADSMQETINQELERVHQLLSPDRTKVALQEIPPFQSAESVKALAAVGFKAENPDVFVSVYVFESWKEHPDAVKMLTATLPTTGTRILQGTNGRLLFIGYTNIEGPNGIKAKFRLSDLISAFSGDE